MPVSRQIENRGTILVASKGEPISVPAYSHDFRTGNNGNHHQQPDSTAVWKGLARIFGFFCVVIVLIVGSDVAISTGLRRIRTSQFGVSNKIVQGKINADIIITGSSRAVSHYDPRVIQSVTGRTAFNIGRNGSQTDMQLAVLKMYLKHNQMPKLVVHNLDAFSFVTTQEVYDPAQYIPYLNEQEIYDALLRINKDAWWKTRHLPMYGYAVEDMRYNWVLGVKGIFGWSPHEDFFQGFNPRAGNWTEDFEKFKAANQDGVRFEIESDGIRDVEELIQLCKGKGIKLVLVYSPEYREMQELTKNRPEIFANFRKLARRYDVPFWDFSDWEFSSNREFFRNSQHLNAEGAELFSKDLANRLASELPQQATN